MAGVLGAAFVAGLRTGNASEPLSPSRYMATVALVKHLDVYGGPENDVSVGPTWNGERMSFDAVVSQLDLEETFRPAFKAAIAAGALGAMCSYNAINGYPSCASDSLLNGFLRQQMRCGSAVGAECLVMSDFGAIESIGDENPNGPGHHYMPTIEQSVAAAVNSGLDTMSGPTDLAAAYSTALAQGLISPAALARSTSRLLHLGFLSGAFDAIALKRVPPSVIGSAAHAALAQTAAARAVTLLENRDGTLPLAASLTAADLVLIGPAAEESTPSQGSYSGLVLDQYNVTLLQAMRARFGASLPFHRGCEDRLRCTNDSEFAAAAAVARGRIAIVAVGHTWRCENLARAQDDPSRRPEPACEMEGSDLAELALPGRQEALIRAVAATASQLVVVLISANPVASEWVAANAAAVVQSYFGGQATALAIVSVLTGDVAPSGRLPFTVPRTAADVPPMNDYTTRANRGYRYASTPPLYPFGYGLSFSTFVYSNLSVVPAGGVPACGRATVRVMITNVQGPTAYEVVQLYGRWRFASSAPASRLAATDTSLFHQPPNPVLKAFASVHVPAGVSVPFHLSLGPDELQAVRTDSFEAACAHGTLDLFVGGGQPNQSLQRTTSNVLQASLRVGL